MMQSKINITRDQYIAHVYVHVYVYVVLFVRYEYSIFNLFYFLENVCQSRLFWWRLVLSICFVVSFSVCIVGFVK